MRQFIIDAFNLFHKIPEIRNADPPYNALVQYIKSGGYTGSCNNKVTMVFDGYKNDLVNETGFRIVYSGSKTADDIIKEYIKRAENKGQLIVVSDDHEIINYARLEGVEVWRTNRFLRLDRCRNIRSRHEDDNKLDDHSSFLVTKELERFDHPPFYLPVITS